MKRREFIKHTKEVGITMRPGSGGRVEEEVVAEPALEIAMPQSHEGGEAPFYSTFQ